MIKNCHLSKSRNCKSIKINNELCFIALPTSIKNSKAAKCITDVLKKLKLDPYTAVEEREFGIDVWCDKICCKIKEAGICIVFLNNEKGSKANANVYYEYGFMTALGKDIIPIQSNRQILKFDVAGRDTIKYKSKKDLEDQLKGAIANIQNSVSDKKQHIEIDTKVTNNIEYYINEACKYYKNNRLINYLYTLDIDESDKKRIWEKVGIIIKGRKFKQSYYEARNGFERINHNYTVNHFSWITNSKHNIIRNDSKIELNKEGEIWSDKQISNIFKIKYSVEILEQNLNKGPDIRFYISQDNSRYPRITCIFPWELAGRGKDNECHIDYFMNNSEHIRFKQEVIKGNDISKFKVEINFDNDNLVYSSSLFENKITVSIKEFEKNGYYVNRPHNIGYEAINCKAVISDILLTEY